MDGLINLYKPTGLTSAKALYRVRKLTRQRKSGHTGTLDPTAEGVLVLCLGRATKLVELLMDHPKVYRATARLDITSASFDSEGPVEPVLVASPPDAARAEDVLRSFEGTIEQVPPALSALKVAGRPAYKLSRAGKPPKLDPRPVIIYWMHFLRYEWPTLEFEVACGRGTYVRALIRDIGRQLGTGGCLTGLLRRAVGPFQVEQSWTLERLAEAPPAEYLIPLEHARGLLEACPIPVPARPKSPSNSDQTRASR